MQFVQIFFFHFLYFTLPPFQLIQCADSICSARSDGSQYFPHSARCQPISLRLISLRFGVTVLREEFPGFRASKLKGKFQWEDVEIGFRENGTRHLEGSHGCVPLRGFPLAARTRKRYLSYRRNNNGATRAEVYGKLNICSRRKKVIVSEYIFRWRRGTHSWRDALRDLINSRSCIRTEIRVRICIYVESFDSRRILRDTTWIKKKNEWRYNGWMDYIEFLLFWLDLRFRWFVSSF